MKKLILKWKARFETFGKYIEYHSIENKTSSYHIRDNYNEEIYYALLEFKSNDIDISETESAIGHKFPRDLLKTLKANYFRIEDDYGNLYTGFHNNIGVLNDCIEIDKFDNPNDFYNDAERYLILHGFSIGKSQSYDDSVIFIAYNRSGEPMLGVHNHDDLILQLEPYTLDALLALIDNDLEEFQKNIIEGFKDDEIFF